MIIDDGIRLVDVSISKSPHTKDCSTSQFSAKVCKVSTFEMFSLSNWSPAQICGFCKVARNILCQRILDSIEFIIANVFADNGFEVSLGYFYPHGNLVGNDEAYRTTFQEFCLLQDFFSDAFALLIIVFWCPFFHLVIRNLDTKVQNFCETQPCLSENIVKLIFCSFPMVFPRRWQALLKE